MISLRNYCNQFGLSTFREPLSFQTDIWYIKGLPLKAFQAGPWIVWGLKWPNSRLWVPLSVLLYICYINLTYPTPRRLSQGDLFCNWGKQTLCTGLHWLKARKLTALRRCTSECCKLMNTCIWWTAEGTVVQAALRPGSTWFERPTFLPRSSIVMVASSLCHCSNCKYTRRLWYQSTASDASRFCCKFLEVSLTQESVESVHRLDTSSFSPVQ